MISRDKFDSLESVRWDRTLFSHMSLAFATTAFALGGEMGINYWWTGSEASAVTVGFCVVLLFIGGLFGALMLWKNGRYEDIRKTLFRDQNILDDRTYLTLSDGSEAQIDHLNVGMQASNHPGTFKRKS